MKTAEEQVKNLIECNCDKMYKSRGLCAPDCPQCNYAEDVIELMDEYAKQNAVEFACHAVVSTGKCDDTEIPDLIKETEDLYDEWKQKES